MVFDAIGLTGGIETKKFKEKVRKNKCVQDLKDYDDADNQTGTF